jgi:hypothetical protein
MTPDHIAIVQASWSELDGRLRSMLPALAAAYDADPRSSLPAGTRAAWLIDAVDSLVDHLRSPSRLAARARRLASTWPDHRAAPSFAVDGQAWMAAAARALPTWSAEIEEAWRQAWLLLSESLAVEALSPFSDRACRADRPGTT